MWEGSSVREDSGMCDNGTCVRPAVCARVKSVCEDSSVCKGNSVEDVCGR